MRVLLLEHRLARPIYQVPNPEMAKLHMQLKGDAMRIAIMQILDWQDLFDAKDIVILREKRNEAP
eukprot:1150840-Pelagomonas_calceolata.AAC.6